MMVFSVVIIVLTTLGAGFAVMGILSRDWYSKFCWMVSTLCWATAFLVEHYMRMR